MKKVLLIMAAALLMMTQCRKQETPSADTIKMTITVGPGAKTYIYDNGAIEWSENDTLYVSDGTNWLGSLKLYSGAGSATGKFTGEISAISNGTTCHFFYLGHDNGMVEPTGTNNAVISFASQNGTREGAFKYHLGHGSAKVTVTDDVATGAVSMRTEIAIAHLKLKMNGEDYTGSVTMDVSNTMTVSPDGTFSGSGNGITIAAGTSGDRYVTLIPTTGTESVDVSFSGSATGSLTFGHGIQANNLYGMVNDGIEVTLAALPYLPGEFSVSESTKVKFSKGNLYYDGTTDNKWKFEANQYDFRTLSTYHRCIDGVYGANSGTDVGRGIFGWSTDGPGCNWGMYDSSTEIGGNFVEWGNNTIDGENGYRTLTSGSDPKGEWDYLITERTGTYNGAAAQAADLFGYATITVSGGSVKGLVLLPDTFVLPDGASFVSSAITGFTANQYTTEQWSAMEEAGAVFLPLTGYYNKAFGGSYQSGQTRYWSSTKYDHPSYPNNVYAKTLLIQDSGASLAFAKVCNCYAVRLVVDVTD